MLLQSTIYVGEHVLDFPFRRNDVGLAVAEFADESQIEQTSKLIAHYSVLIGKKWEVKPVSLSEVEVLVYGVHRNADHLHAKRFVFLDILFKALGLNSASTCKVSLQ